MNFVADFLPVLNIVLAIGLALGGFLAFRRGWSKEAGEAQAHLIEVLEKEVASVRREVEDLKRERSTQDNVLRSIRYLLKSYGLKIMINGDVVTIQEQTGGNKKTTRISGGAPVVPLTGDDDDAV